MGLKSHARARDTAVRRCTPSDEHELRDWLERDRRSMNYSRDARSDCERRHARAVDALE